MTSTASPQSELDSRYSSENATAEPWSHAVGILESAEIFWLTTVRADGRPHVTPLIAVWHDDALFFCTGSTEQKFHNLEQNPHCTLHTGTNRMGEGFDVMIEGEAVPCSDHLRLQHVAALYVTKYGEEWRFSVKDGMFDHGHGQTPVFGVQPVTAYGFGRGETFTHIRWRF
jgi:uncharacterized pyridoxamine 5'-phosphate oxidase family protein